jgi:pyridoxine 5-phosphate synthase
LERVEEEKMTLLGVNIDHIATLRQARGTHYPDPVKAALLAEAGGADGITVHLREDRRHIQERDVYLIKEALETRLNLEMAVTKDMLAFAEKLKPFYACFVPEKREELTTEGGLDVASDPSKFREACSRLQKAGIEVSLFIDPEPKQIEAAQQCGATIIEIHTGHYADAADKNTEKQALKRIIEATELGISLGLQVNAGHGLHYHNVQAIAQIPGMCELNIGHSIVSESVFCGLETAVRTMKCLIEKASQ